MLPECHAVDRRMIALAINFEGGSEVKAPRTNPTRIDVILRGRAGRAAQSALLIIHIDPATRGIRAYDLKVIPSSDPSLRLNSRAIDSESSELGE